MVHEKKAPMFQFQLHRLYETFFWVPASIYMPENEVTRSSKRHCGNGTRRIQLLLVVSVLPDVILTIFIPAEQNWHFLKGKKKKFKLKCLQVIITCLSGQSWRCALSHWWLRHGCIPGSESRLELQDGLQRKSTPIPHPHTLPASVERCTTSHTPAPLLSHLQDNKKKSFLAKKKSLKGFTAKIRKYILFRWLNR